MDVTKTLLSASDPVFRDFNARLLPTIDKERIIGVKTPDLKKIVKQLISEGEAEEFLGILPHEYFEENQIHAFIICEMKDFDRALLEVERFLPYVYNWATCDQMVIKAFAKNPERLLIRVDEWLGSDHVYTVRFAIGILMRYFLDDRFDEKYLDKVAAISTDEYYINMMSAWYFATALAKQYDATLPYIKEKRLPVWVHNKTISKACESFRVSDGHKMELKLLTIKNR